MKKIYLSIIMLSLTYLAKSQSVSLKIPFNVAADRAYISNLPAGTIADSVLVKTNGWIGRIANPDPGYTISATTIGLSKSTLNSTYPNVPIRHMVFCPSITLGGAIYIKVTENGTNDTWQTISAPPTL